MRVPDWMWVHFMAWQKTWNPTSFLAVWGAIVSTGTLLWTLRKDLRDSSDIRVEVSLRRFGPLGKDGKRLTASPAANIQGLGDQLDVVMPVTNVGRRKIQWAGWGGEYRERVNGRDKFQISPQDLPRILEEQAHHVEWAFLDPQLVNGNVRRLFIWGVAGRKWYVSRRNMRTLLADIQKFATDQPRI